MNLFIVLALIHWGFATGGILAIRTDWSIPRFLIKILLIKYFLITYDF
jgi:hypothetical protein